MLSIAFQLILQECSKTIWTVLFFIVPLVKLGTGKKQSVLVIRVRLKPKTSRLGVH